MRVGKRPVYGALIGKDASKPDNFHALRLSQLWAGQLTWWNALLGR